MSLGTVWPGEGPGREAVSPGRPRDAEGAADSGVWLRERPAKLGGRSEPRPRGASQTSDSRVSDRSDMPSAGDGTSAWNGAGVPLEAIGLRGRGCRKGWQVWRWVGGRGGPGHGLEWERAVHPSHWCRDGRRAGSLPVEVSFRVGEGYLGVVLGSLTHRAVSVLGSAVRGRPSRSSSWASGQLSMPAPVPLASASSLASAAWLFPARRERERPGAELSPWLRPHQRLRKEGLWGAPSSVTAGLRNIPSPEFMFCVLCLQLTSERLHGRGGLRCVRLLLLPAAHPSRECRAHGLRASGHRGGEDLVSTQRSTWQGRKAAFKALPSCWARGSQTRRKPAQEAKGPVPGAAQSSFCGAHFPRRRMANRRGDDTLSLEAPTSPGPRGHTSAQIPGGAQRAS